MRSEWHQACAALALALLAHAAVLFGYRVSTVRLEPLQQSILLRVAARPAVRRPEAAEGLDQRQLGGAGRPAPAPSEPAREMQPLETAKHTAPAPAPSRLGTRANRAAEVPQTPRDTKTAPPEPTAGEARKSSALPARTVRPRAPASAAREAAALASYEQLLAAWIDRYKTYPVAARRRRQQGMGVVRVRVARGGRLLGVTLERSTRYPLLDAAALDAVRRAAPFPPMPRELAGESREFLVPFVFTLM